MIDGQGADELFFGYTGYPRLLLANAFKYHNASQILRTLFKLFHGRKHKLVADFTRVILRNHKIDKLYLKQTNPIKNHIIQSDNREISSLHPENPVNHQNHIMTVVSSNLQRLLRVADRNSMRWSVESRVPFLDKEILEFVLSINPTLHVGDHGETKMLLRSAFTGKVPAKILSRRDKIGFVSNESRWFSTNIDLVIDTLKSCKNIPFVDFQAISEVIYKRHKLGYQHHSALWRAFNLARWYDLA